MSRILPTNICCLDLAQDCIDYLTGIGFNVFEGTLGSVYKLDWNKLKNQFEVPVLIDCSLPSNIQEYHVFVHDMSRESERDYKLEEHDLYDRVERPSQKYLECEKPISIYDLRPYGAKILNEKFAALGSSHKRIVVVFAPSHHKVDYHLNEIGCHSPHHLGEFDIYDAWKMAFGNNQYGKRVQLTDSRLSYDLFNEHLDSAEYYCVFSQPTVRSGNKSVPDERFIPLLRSENGDCISYAYINGNPERYEFVFPQVKDKKKLLKSLFETFLFAHFSDFFPDVDAKQWILNKTYELPDETTIREEIEAKRQAYQDEIKELSEKAERIKASNIYLKKLLTASGDDLVDAVKSYLDYLGFNDVVDKDSTLKDGEIREEDLAFSYNGTNLLVEVKGINGTSTDSECSQIDKVVLRRIRKTNNTKYHGVYVVNNQRNVEPLKRQMPPFNNIQIEDAENQGRTMAFTAQLFALYSDIENGYVSKKEVRECFLVPGLLDPHGDLLSIGVPPKFFEDRTVLCFHLKDILVQPGDFLFYFDDLHRMVAAEILDIQIDRKSLQSATSGEVSIKVSKPFPKSAEVFVKRQP